MCRDRPNRPARLFLRRLFSCPASPVTGAPGAAPKSGGTIGLPARHASRGIITDERGFILQRRRGDEMREAMAAMALLGAVVAASPASATNYPWCTTGAMQEFGARNCGFVSFEQCMDTARGNGQNCDRNPFYEEPPKTARPRVHKKRTNP